MTWMTSHFVWLTFDFLFVVFRFSFFSSDEGLIIILLRTIKYVISSGDLNSWRTGSSSRLIKQTKNNNNKQKHYKQKHLSLSNRFDAWRVYCVVNDERGDVGWIRRIWTKWALDFMPRTWTATGYIGGPQVTTSTRWSGWFVQGEHVRVWTWTKRTTRSPFIGFGALRSHV